MRPELDPQIQIDVAQQVERCRFGRGGRPAELLEPERDHARRHFAVGSLGDRVDRLLGLVEQVIDVALDDRAVAGIVGGRRSRRDFGRAGLGRPRRGLRRRGLGRFGKQLLDVVLAQELVGVARDFGRRFGGLGRLGGLGQQLLDFVLVDGSVVDCHGNPFPWSLLFDEREVADDDPLHEGFSQGAVDFL